MFDWLLPSKSSDQYQIVAPTHFIDPKSQLYIQCTPNDPHTASNIVLTAFRSKQQRIIVPIRVQWSKSLKLQVLKSNNELYPIQRITSHRSNSYICSPSDLGAFLHAKITSLDDDKNQKYAQITIGPIKIDVMIKRLMEGAMFSGSLLSQIILIDGQKQKNATLRLNIGNMQIIQDQTQQRFQTEYEISEPQIELNPKDYTKLYLRFEQDQKNRAFNYLNKIFQRQNKLCTMSLSKSSQKQSSRSRLFRNNHCLNKFQIKFISRHTRDLFLFMQKAFICKQMLKSTVIFQRMEKMKMLETQQDFQQFLEFMALREQINRLYICAKQLEYDRDKKIGDVNQLQESVDYLTLQYKKLIQQKGKQFDIDFNRSYSQIGQKRQQMLHRKNFRELKQQNIQLKKQMKYLKEQMDILKFAKRQSNNDSLIFNKSINDPFMKNNQGQFLECNNKSYREQQSKNVFQLSKINAKLLRENQSLKQKFNFKQGKDKSMVQLLNSIHLDDSREDQQRIIIRLTKQINKLKHQIKGNDISFHKNYKPKISHTLTHSIQNLSQRSNNSYADEIQPNESININQSMTSQAQFKMLQDKFFQIKSLNEKILSQNGRLRKERDHYRQLLKQYIKKQKQIQTKLKNEPQPQTSNVLKIKQQNECLINQRNLLYKKNDSLLKQINQIKSNTNYQMKKDNSIVQALRNQNLKLKQQIQQFKQNPNRTNESNKDNFFAQNQRMKRINCDLLDQIKNLKIKIQQIKYQMMSNSRIIQLENQNRFLKRSNNTDGTQQLLEQLGLYSKEIERLKQQSKIKQFKLDNQTQLIDKLMNANSDRSQQSQKHSDLKQTKSQCKSEEVVQKYKKKIKQLQEEIMLLRRSSDVLNKSRDISMDYSGFYEDKVQALNIQLKRIQNKNKNLTIVCENQEKDIILYQKLKKQILNSSDKKFISLLKNLQN